MATLQENPVFEEGIFQIERSTPPLGGPPLFSGSNPTQGHANAQAVQLANRTQWLRNESVNKSNAADLSNSEDSVKGASLIGFDGDTVASILTYNKKLSNYTSLRNYVGVASSIGLLANGIRGEFSLDPSDTSSADNGWSIIVDLLGRRWKRQGISKGAEAEWFGIKTDGTNSTDNWQLALDALSNSGIPLLLPSGTINIDSLKGGRLVGDLTIIGKGISKSVISYNNYASTTNHKPVLYTDSAVGASSELDLQELSIRGAWGSNPNYSEANSLISVFNFSKVRVHKCGFYGSRSGGVVTGNTNHVQVTGCEFERHYRDALRVANSVTTIVSLNTFRDCCDDSIAVTNDDNNPVKETTSIVTNNILIDSQGIACLGAKTTVIDSNQIKRATHRAILTGQAESTFSEGHTAGLSVIISNNIITDGFTGSVFSSLQGSGFRAIEVSGKAFTAKDTVETAVSGVVVKPWPYLYTKATDQTGVVNAGVNNIKIHSNSVIRTLTATANYSDYGFGQRLSRSGFVNPPITLNDMMLEGIYISSGGNGTSIDDNTIDGCNIGANLNIGVAPNGVSIRNWSITKNKIKNFRTAGIEIIASGHINISDNEFDGDPYNENPLRSNTGGWNNSFINNRAVRLTSNTSDLSGTVIRNTFKNVGIPVLRGNGENYTSLLVKNNTLVCQPSVTGYNAANKGIGFVPLAANLDAMVIIEDCDPSSSNFKKLINTCLTQSASVPTTGYYLVGTFVFNTSSNATMGWYRATNGTAHVLGTDWIAR